MVHLLSFHLEQNSFVGSEVLYTTMHRCHCQDFTHDTHTSHVPCSICLDKHSVSYSVRVGMCVYVCALEAA